MIADRQAPTLTLRSSAPSAAATPPAACRCGCAARRRVRSPRRSRVSARDARRLGRRRKALVVAAGEAAVDAAGSTYVFFDVIRAAQRRLFGSRSVRATLGVLAVDAAGNRTATTARSLVFRR